MTPARQIPGVLIAMAGVGAAFIVAIHIGFSISGQRAPLEVESMWFGSAIVLAVAIIIGLYAALRGRAFVIRGAQPETPPLRSWEPERNQYRGNRAELATCEHLQPIERAIRDTAIEIRFSMPLRVEARCTVNGALLQQRFVLPPSVHYMESMAGLRQYDPPWAAITCDVCTSTIDVLSEQQAERGTPVFPQ